jgi:hypothetical protein
VNETRVAPRHRVLKAGTIEFGGGAIDCTLRNLSNNGAALDVTSPIGIPDRFTLVLPGQGLHKPCHVVWRKQRRLGVAFDQAVISQETAPVWDKPIAQCHNSRNRT